MKDRVPTQVLPNGAIRYEEFNSSEVSQGYKYLKLADEPTEVGTALNKAFGDASFFVTFAHARIGTNNELTNADGGENIRFVVSANTEATDTWTVNGTGYTLKDQSGETYEAELKAGAIVSCFADNTNHVLNFKSGGAGLNFALKPYATEAALLADSPADGTVGVVTATEISGYAFVAATSEITSPATGMVAIVEGTASSASFNALKKNTLNVYPLSCYQYSGSAWAQKTCYVRKGGAWIAFATFLFSDNDQHTDITGGYSLNNFTSGLTLTASFNAAGTLTYTAISVNSINLASFSNLVFNASSASNNTSTSYRVAKIGFSANNTADTSFVASYDMLPTGSEGLATQDRTLDLSALTGSYYFKLVLNKANATGVNITASLTLNSAKLE